MNIICLLLCIQFILSIYWFSFLFCDHHNKGWFHDGFNYFNNEDYGMRVKELNSVWWLDYGVFMIQQRLLEDRFKIKSIFNSLFSISALAYLEGIWQ